MDVRPVQLPGWTHCVCNRTSGVAIMLRGDVPEILTARLALIAITAETLESEKAADGQLGQLIQCGVPANWPPVDWEPHVLDMLLAQFDRDPTQVGWHRYVGLIQPDGSRLLIGSLGAFSAGVGSGGVRDRVHHSCRRTKGRVWPPRRRRACLSICAETVGCGALLPIRFRGWRGQSG